MLEFRCGKNQKGQPVLLVQSQEAIDPVEVLRALKQALPELWQKVHLEMVVPKANGVNRILTEGK